MPSLTLARTGQISEPQEAALTPDQTTGSGYVEGTSGTLRGRAQTALRRGSGGRAVCGRLLRQRRVPAGVPEGGRLVGLRSDGDEGKG